jgi:hypothetical protein
MWMRLAALWGCPVAEAQARCTAAEFAEWLAYYAIEPWGEAGAYLRHGILASVVANTRAGGGGRTWSAADFMPNVSREQRESDEAGDQRAQIDAVFGRP